MRFGGEVDRDAMRRGKVRSPSILKNSKHVLPGSILSDVSLFLPRGRVRVRSPPESPISPKRSIPASTQSLNSDSGALSTSFRGTTSSRPPARAALALVLLPFRQPPTAVSATAFLLGLSTATTSFLQCTHLCSELRRADRRSGRS